MSHLGDNLSALVDGELTGTDLDRATAHVASCERCRVDTAALRALKVQLRGLTAHSGHDDFMPKLIALAGRPGASLSGATAVQPSFRRYAVWGAVSLAVVGGVGAAAFGMGGGPSVPDVVPQEMVSVQHASITGDVPFQRPSPSAQRAAQHRP